MRNSGLFLLDTAHPLIGMQLGAAINKVVASFIANTVTKEAT